MVPERPSGVRPKEALLYPEGVVDRVQLYMRYDVERLANLHQGVPEELLHLFMWLDSLSDTSRAWVQEQCLELIEEGRVRLRAAFEILDAPSREMIQEYEQVLDQMRDAVQDPWYARALRRLLEVEKAWRSSYGARTLSVGEIHKRAGWSKLMLRALKESTSPRLSLEEVTDQRLEAYSKHGPPRPPKLPREFVGKGKTEAKAPSVPTPAPVPVQSVPSVTEEELIRKKREKGIQRRRLLTAEEGAMDAHSWRWAPKRAVRPVPTPHPHGGYEGDGDDE
jgi:hypothetical protein